MSLIQLYLQVLPAEISKWSSAAKDWRHQYDELKDSVRGHELNIFWQIVSFLWLKGLCRSFSSKYYNLHNRLNYILLTVNFAIISRSSEECIMCLRYFR